MAKLTGGALTSMRADATGAQSVTGNAAKAGLKNGDQIIYHSSFFGDELWPVRPAATPASPLRPPYNCRSAVYRGLCSPSSHQSSLEQTVDG
jgi:hypothetical protein